MWFTQLTWHNVGVFTFSVWVPLCACVKLKSVLLIYVLDQKMRTGTYTNVYLLVYYIK